jgi:hypothetical protein
MVLKKLDVFLKSPFSLALDRILGNLSHHFLHQTERWLVALHLHVFDSEIFSVLLWCVLICYESLIYLGNRLFRTFFSLTRCLSVVGKTICYCENLYFVVSISKK